VWGSRKLHGSIILSTHHLPRAIDWCGEKLGLSSESPGSNPSEAYLGYESGE
jgi:hypothetical protein